ncbi:HAD family hydrolase [Effusibacillus consociatus]|uniref:HAD family hydrolase n=1 Tax=Effusibacillus consociatus TaxID=1117041 RepID=A0ABV9PXD1_9BACL
MIKAIVFDFDGLIFDTETHEYRVLEEIYKSHGAELPLEVWGQCVGTHANFFDAYAYLEQCIGKPVDRDVLGKQRREMFDLRVENETALPGVENYLVAAKRLGLKIGLASSSNRAWVTRWLTKLNLLDYFECIRTADDVEHVKPDPALYLKACECLGVQPQEAIAFEDSPNGAIAAKRAGMHCVIVPNFVTTTLTFGEHDLRLNSMAEMELEKVIERLERK